MEHPVPCTMQAVSVNYKGFAASNEMIRNGEQTVVSINVSSSS